jgi:hypothetical protein
MVATKSDFSRLADCRLSMSRAFSSATAMACAMPSVMRRSFSVKAPSRRR